MDEGCLDQRDLRSRLRGSVDQASAGASTAVVGIPVQLVGEQASAFERGRRVNMQDHDARRCPPQR